jgi:2-methylisocitrate lyase-like PEP mutase family enzyme
MNAFNGRIAVVTGASSGIGLATARSSTIRKVHMSTQQAAFSHDASSAQEKAATLRALHVAGDPLVLPNVWDAASARMVEAAGFPVVATSSAATAVILGFDDGEATPVEEMLAATERIVRAVGLPVTVDFERGYGLAPAELVERFAATGAVGLNLEDSNPPSGEMIDAAEQAGFLAAVRDAAVSLGVDLVINARTDSFLRRAGSPEAQLAATLDRGARYLAAGADCVYPIAVVDPVVIRALVEGIPGPINVGYGQQGKLSLADFAALGVARVSFGPSLQRHLYNKFGSALFSAVASDQNPFAL